MALILTQKYTGSNSYRSFLVNRFLRIFPAYWMMLFLTIAYFLFARWRFNASGPLDVYRPPFGYGIRTLITSTNWLLFGQDIVHYLSWEPRGRIFFTPDPRVIGNTLWPFLLIPPSWSLAIELYFYLFAPFIVRRSAMTMVAIILASLGLRVWIYRGLGWNHDPWTDQGQRAL